MHCCINRAESKHVDSKVGELRIYIHEIRPTSYQQLCELQQVEGRLTESTDEMLEIVMKFTLQVLAINDH